MLNVQQDAITNTQPLPFTHTLAPQRTRQDSMLPTHTHTYMLRLDCHDVRVLLPHELPQV
jgi:hypothetical protein